jgi:hypothetical protein
MAADVPDSAQVSQLLSEAKAQAFQLKEDAATLQSFTGSNLGWQSHAAVVNQMKEHVNAWATSLPSWKKTANQLHLGSKLPSTGSGPCYRNSLPSWCIGTVKSFPPMPIARRKSRASVYRRAGMFGID